MLNFWQRALLPVLISALLALLVWAMLGALSATIFLLCAVLFMLLRHLHQLATLDDWLAHRAERSIPEGSGLWEDSFAHLNKMLRQYAKEKERRNAALQAMEQATSALPEGVAILDETDHVEWCNPLAERHFGLDGERDIGQQITYLARQPEFVKYLARAEFSEPLILRGVRHDDLILSIKIITYGANKRLLISRDITHFERIETMRRDFVANVSHELRTPLTVVNGFVETLQDMPNLDNDMSRRALGLMGEQTRRMENLVNDLLTLSTLENSQNTLQETQIGMEKMLDTVLQEGKNLSAGRHHITLEMPSLCDVQGNADELHSAFGNLLSNAVRYTPDGGNIVLRWQLGDDGQAVFSVQDGGIGIAAQHIPRLTERFYRVDHSRSRATGGTGLGLAIVKHIANRHQAQLDIDSREGEGSTFSMTFPARRVG
jgi:two-component system, OmpR family, phosphate regulon sensor histidine kinase PhoR